MAALHTLWEYAFSCCNVQKRIRIQIGDICSSDEEFNLLVCSAFKNDYIPTPRSLIGALQFQKQISVEQLAKNPEIDLKDYGCWLSQPILSNFHRIACVELIDLDNYEPISSESRILKKAFSTFRFLLEQASLQEIPIRSVALPILGTGDQQIEECFIVPPLVQQCLHALKIIPELETITFFARRESNVSNIIDYLNKTLVSRKESAPDLFISYSSKQYEIAENIFNHLTGNGFSCWMAPESIPTGSSYQEEIPLALNQISSLILLLTHDAEKSRWVQKEVGTAIGANKRIYPLQLEDFSLGRNFRFLLDGEQIYTAWDKDTKTWLNDIVKKLKRAG